MSTWRSSPGWHPPQFGWFVPTDAAPFFAWLAPAAAGALWMAGSMTLGGALPVQSDHLAQLGLPGSYWSATLLYSPLWGFPAVLTGLVVRALLLRQGWFGWASALILGAVAGLAAPMMLGANLWLAGPLYGATFLWVQYAIFKMRYGPRFDAVPRSIS
jgi:hypothetical protein